MTTQNSMPKSVKIYAWLMLVWNALGVLAFFMHISMSPEAIAQLPPEQQPLYENFPLWSVLAFAIAVFGGLLGTILLIMKKALALPVFILSLLGILAQQYYNFMVIDSIALMGQAAVIMPVIVVIIAISLILVSQRGKQSGWLN